MHSYKPVPNGEHNTMTSKAVAKPVAFLWHHGHIAASIASDARFHALFAIFQILPALNRDPAHVM